LKSSVDIARLSRRLVTLEDHTPIVFDEEQLRYLGPDLRAQRDLFEELEFRRLIKPVPGEEEEAPEEPAAPTEEVKPSGESINRDAYRLVVSEEDLAWLVAQLTAAETISIHVESSSHRFADADLFGIAFAWGRGSARTCR